MTGRRTPVADWHAVGFYGLAGLTMRQQEVAARYCTNPQASYAAVAFEMGLSEQTVKNHISKLLRRTGGMHISYVCYLYGLANGSDRPVDAMRADAV